MEQDLIDIFRQALPVSSSLWIGIGDDAAGIFVAEQRLLTTSDMLLDQIHFDTLRHSLVDIGYKTVAVNISDLIAMAAKPEHIMISIALPKTWRERDVCLLAEGMAEACREFEVGLIGGDTNCWQHPLVVNVSAFGTPRTTQVPLRSHAQSGDVILVSGPLGGSGFGRHLRPKLRLDLVAYLCDQYSIHGMMDISDGVATDLPRICLASGLGAQILGDQVPIHRDVQNHYAQVEWLNHALNDGEDFELLLTTSMEQWRAMQLDQGLAGKLYAIGHMQSGVAIELVQNGIARPLKNAGYRHQLAR